MITYIRGDATAPATRPAVIVHICNDIGAWGAGFVLAVSERWKQPEAEYRAAFRDGKALALGSVQFVEVEPGLTVANVVGQRDIRRSAKGEPPIRYGAVRQGLEKVAAFALDRKATVHMPRIGCGLAGGKWEEIEPIIEATLGAIGVAVVVYDFASK